MNLLEEFKNKYLGKQVEYHSYGTGAYNQCVDLVNLYIHECLDNSTKDYTEIIGTNAKDFKDKYDPEDFDFITNSTSPNVIPERGDIIIWNGRVGGGAGHVAVFLKGDGMSFTSLDQNWSQVERVTEEAHNYTNVSGWLRPKNFATDCSDFQEKASYYDEIRELINVDDKWSETEPRIKELIKTEDSVDGLEKIIEKQSVEIKEKIETIEAQQRQISNANEQITLLTNNLQKETDKKEKIEIELNNLKIAFDQYKVDKEAEITILQDLHTGDTARIADIIKDRNKYKDLYKGKLNDAPKWDLFLALFGR